MKYEGLFDVDFDEKEEGKFSIQFPKAVQTFPDKTVWSQKALWESKGSDNRMYPLTQLAQKNIEEVCAKFTSRGYIGCKKAGKVKLTSIKYVLFTSLNGYEFVKG